MDIIKEMLKKDITRPINGVVKAETNSEDVELIEISEYVVTREVRGHMSKLFTRYSDSINTPTDDMGIWISGFFGSGKSHLLKMLGHIFENKNYLYDDNQEKSTTDFFREKLNDDEILMGNIERSSKVDTDVILFNIDNVSDQNSHQNKDTIALSFLKKLNEYQGFFRDDIKVSELERDLWKKDRFEEFKNLYKDISGKEWEEARRNLDFNADFFLEVIGEMSIDGFSEEAAERWLDKDIVPSVSAEYLKDTIKDYLDKKGKEHRIIFLVDEIGQYIGDNSQLMLNLQTVTEVLGTAFQGRVWIGVTSQQDMTSLLQDNNNKKNDFSKIQGRFKNILPLSSGNIDEVIKKRLLEKKEIVKEDLENYYEKHRVEIDNLISFDKQGLNLETYIDKHDFAETYPFVGYQFNLLQKVFEKVRTMGHSGKHLSQGERSLLSAFQEAGIKMNEKETGALVPFYYFFDSIKQFLEDNAYRPFLHAEQNRALDQDEDIKVLQLLFLLKDMEGIAPNIDNLASFMIENIDTDIVELKKNLKKSLGRLEQQVLISRDGDFYYFLTNEEQEINKEIKDESVLEEEIYKRLNEIVFDNIIQTNSITVPETGYKYTFNRYIDGYSHSKTDGQINLSIFTSWSDDYDNILMVGNREEHELIIQLPRVDNYLKEIKVILQTQKLISNKSTQVNRTRIQDILTRVQRENRNRINRVKEEIENHILNSSVYVKGIQKDISCKNAKTFLEEAVRFLAMEKFKDAGLIKRKYDENYIKDILLSEYEAQQKLEITLDKESNPNKEAIFEINNKIKQLTDRGLQVTLKILLDNYSIAPYGWDALAVNGITAELIVLGSINILESGELIDDRKELQKLLTKTQTKNLERVVIKPKEDIDPQLLTRVNNKLKSVFGTCEDIRKNPKEDLFKIVEGQKNLANMNLREIKANSYPGEKITKEWIDLLNEILQIRGKATAVLKEFLNLVEDLEDIEPKYYAVKDFFNTKKKDKFDLMNQKLKKYDTYKDYFITIHKENAYKELLSIREDSNPYGKIKDIDGLLDDLGQKEKETIKEEIESLKEKANSKRNKLSKVFEAHEKLNNSLNNKIDNFLGGISNLESIEVFHKERELNNICDALIRDYKEDIKSDINQKERYILEKLRTKDDITELENRVIKAYAKLRTDVDNEENIVNIKDYLTIAESEKTQFLNEADGKAQKRQRVHVRRLQAKPKINVETEEDVNNYIALLEEELQKLKQEMINAVKENKIVDVK